MTEYWVTYEFIDFFNEHVNISLLQAIKNP